MDKIDIRDLIVRTLKENSEEINSVEIVEQTSFLKIADSKPCNSVLLLTTVTKLKTKL